MVRNYQVLRDSMSPERRAANEAAAKEMLAFTHPNDPQPCKTRYFPQNPKNITFHVSPVLSVALQPAVLILAS